MNIVRLHQLWESVINALMQACSTFMVSETAHYITGSGYWFWLLVSGYCNRQMIQFSLSPGINEGELWALQMLGSSGLLPFLQETLI